MSTNSDSAPGRSKHKTVVCGGTLHEVTHQCQGCETPFAFVADTPEWDAATQTASEWIEARCAETRVPDPDLECPQCGSKEVVATEDLY